MPIYQPRRDRPFFFFQFFCQQHNTNYILYQRRKLFCLYMPHFVLSLLFAYAPPKIHGIALLLFFFFADFYFISIAVYVCGNVQIDIKISVFRDRILVNSKLKRLCCGASHTHATICRRLVQWNLNSVYIMASMSSGYLLSFEWTANARSKSILLMVGDIFFFNFFSHTLLFWAENRFAGQCTALETGQMTAYRTPML